MTSHGSAAPRTENGDPLVPLPCILAHPLISHKMADTHKQRLPQCMYIAPGVVSFRATDPEVDCGKMTGKKGFVPTSYRISLRMVLCLWLWG